MFIRKITIENFKKFQKKRTFEFKDGLNILVGDNETGKSTVLEAVHLALTGYYHGRALAFELSQTLFNKNAIDDWLKSAGKGILPKIMVEVFFGDCSDEMFKGNHNSEGDGNACGIRFSVLFNEDYKEELEAIVESKEISGLPIEYYEVRLETFAREIITTRSIPIKSLLIDASEYKAGYNVSDVYISKIIKNRLEVSEKIAVAQAMRSLKGKLGKDETITKINCKLNEELAETIGHISLGVNIGTVNAWEKDFVLECDGIPLSYKGKGTQCFVKTHLALSDKKSDTSDIILLEEPESHLSFSNLNQLLRYIETKCEKKQILVTTHSSFVTNKLGLDRLILMSENETMKMNDLHPDTSNFFKKLPGYDTLRLILCKVAILCEGRSDELIIQRAYRDRHGHLPIEDGIDVISCEGLSFLRFLEIADKLKLKDVRVVTDNDGDVQKLEKKYENYLYKNKKDNIKICYDQDVNPRGENDPENYNPNTLESNLLKANDLKTLNAIFGRNRKDECELGKYMQQNKAECALKIFESSEKINYPKYIQDAVTFPK